MEKYKEKVYFIGAGPGDPELITIKGQRIVKEADVIIYAGSLVPKEVIDCHKEGAEIYNSASMSLDEVIDVTVKAIKDSKKVISIYKENKKLIYVYGSEGEKAEKTIIGTANKNLFKNENEIPLNENNNNKLTENFILFKIKNYTYLISFYNNYGVKENSYTLTVAKNDEEILFDKELDISTVHDNLFNTNFFKKLPYDNGVVAYYVTYD